MTLDRMKLSAQTVRDNIAILEEVKEPDDAGWELQLEHEKFVLECIEKQIPKEPIRKSAIQQSCPNCGGTFTSAYVMLHNNCWHCGQALSFDGKEENNATP